MAAESELGVTVCDRCGEQRWAGTGPCSSCPTKKVTVSDLVTPETVERITGLTPEMLAAIGKVELAREESRDDAWWSGYAQGKDEAETRDLNFDELTDQVEDLRAQLAAADRIANERQRLSLDQTLSMLIVDELDAGNDERAASLRSLRAWNRGAGYVIPRRVR